MPGKWDHGKRKGAFALIFLVLILLFGFSPISGALLHRVHGSFAPSPYSSLSLANQSELNRGVAAGEPVLVLLTNHSHRTNRYVWRATQQGRVISQGAKVLKDGEAEVLQVPSRGATRGRLRISLNGSDIFVTITIRKSGK
jgi:hypothetical protein